MDSEKFRRESAEETATGAVNAGDPRMHRRTTFFQSEKAGRTQKRTWFSYVHSVTDACIGIPTYPDGPNGSGENDGCSCR